MHILWPMKFPTFAIKYNLTPIKTLFCIILISHCSRRYDKDVDDDLCYMRSYSLMAIKLMRSIVILLGSRKNYTWLKGHWKVTHGWSKMYMSTFLCLVETYSYESKGQIFMDENILCSINKIFKEFKKVFIQYFN